MATDILITTTIVATSCGVCNVQFGMERAHHQRCLDDSEQWFWCPNGHHIHYCTGEKQKLRDELAREKHRTEQARAEANEVRAQRDAARRSRNAQRGIVTRIKNRVGRGVCPCCNRTFQNLGRHMQGQHPTWTPEVEHG